MKATIKNNIVEIEADFGEQLEIVKSSIYPDRIIVFKTIDEYTLQEVHFENSTGNRIERTPRKESFPKFEYPFPEINIIGTIEHKFLDELNFGEYKPKGIDIETISVRLFKDGEEISKSHHAHPTNKFQDDYYESVKESVDRFLKSQESTIQHNSFLAETYAKWTSAEKANYHCDSILFQDRMQGGYPSGYKNPAATYLSKWFMDTYSPFDGEPLLTLKQIAVRFNINSKYLMQMVQYEVTSSEWQAFARKLNLLDN